MSSQAKPQPQAEPPVLRLFISYASEDVGIALAIAKGLREALGDGFAEVSMDKWFLQAGDVFKKELEAKLEKTNELVIVYTGVDKQSHSYTGWEVGYFERGMKSHPERRIVPLFLEQLPPTAADTQGISLNVPRDLLHLTVEEFSAENSIDKSDPACSWIRRLQELVQNIREEAHYPKVPLRDEQDAVLCVQKIRLAIFGHLKTTVDAVLKPQKQITIKTTGAALRASEGGLPADAMLIPQGADNPMLSIFGISGSTMSWSSFLQQVPESFKHSWKQAISSVITSSLAESFNVDNSQIIISSNGSETYRVVLTTATSYYNDIREFNLYFVQTLRQNEYGDEGTTLLLKGLELICRYRFMFLESSSEFSSQNIALTAVDHIPDRAAKLLRELELMRTNSQNARLDQPAVWMKFVEYNDIQKMVAVYRPAEPRLRELIAQILAKKGDRDALAQLGDQLSKEIGSLAEETRPLNTLLIKAMSSKLQALVDEQS
jgi:TIR domain